MFSKLILFISSSLLFLSGNGKKSESYRVDNPAEIIIIGTVHISTPNYNSDTLLEILNKINPGAILIECDTSFMTPDFELKDDVKYSFMETSAVTKYKKNKSVQLRPIDIPGGDSFFDDPDRKINESNFFNDIRLISKSKNENLNEEAAYILDRISDMMNTAEVMVNSKASYINSPEGKANADTINYYTYTGLSRLINLIPELTQYKKYWDKEYSNWNKRNNVMLGNILKYKKYFEGKRIVVLCGFAHMNFLKAALLKNRDLILKEFWDY